MSDFGFVNRRDGVRSQAAAPRRGPPPQQQGPPVGAGGPARGPMPRPMMPRPAAPPVRQFPQQPPQPPVQQVTQPMATPVSILKRPQQVTIAEPEIMDSAVSASPSAVAFDDSAVRALEAQVAELKETVADLSKKLASESKTVRDSSCQFYGLVAPSRVLLFDAIPKEFSVDKATAKADKNTWVKLSYPQMRVERSLPNGSTTIDLWLRAHAIDPTTSNVNAFWVREKTAEDTPSFSKFAWYPTTA